MGLLLLRELLLWFLSLLLSLLLPLLSLLRSDELHVTNDMGETALVREEDIASSASSAGSVCCCFCCNREVVVAARVGDGRLFDDEAVAALMTRVVDASWFSVDDNTDFGVPARLPSPLRRRPPVARPTSSPMRTVTVAASVMPLFRRRRRRRPTAVAPSPSGTLRRRGRCDDISSEGDGEGSLARCRLRGHGRAGERGRWRGELEAMMIWSV